MLRGEGYQSREYKKMWRSEKSRRWRKGSGMQQGVAPRHEMFCCISSKFRKASEDYENIALDRGCLTSSTSNGSGKS